MYNLAYVECGLECSPKIGYSEEMTAVLVYSQAYGSVMSMKAS